MKLICGRHRGFIAVCSFSMTLRRLISSLHNVPMATGEMAALVLSKRNIFQLSAEIYVTFLQRKCGDYEIMQAPHILRGNWQFMQRKCAAFEKMQPPHKYADFGWLCIELYDRIIRFFWRDWLVSNGNNIYQEPHVLLDINYISHTWINCVVDKIS